MDLKDAEPGDGNLTALGGLLHDFLNDGVENTSGLSLVAVKPGGEVTDEFCLVQCAPCRSESGVL